MGRTVSGDLLALSTTAVVAIYVAGYAITQPAAGLLDRTSTVAPPRLANRGFRDGSYLGSGDSKFGKVYVTVQVRGGRIDGVWINSVTTTFPAQVLVGMPATVVARQTADVDLLSGATGSSSAFVLAVREALRQAQV